jgi:segregation and condensation protein B
LEALLFVSDEPVSSQKLAQMVEADAGEVEKALYDLADEYAEDDRGFQLRKIADGWKLKSNPSHHDLIVQYVLSWDTKKLSQAALEALAVIAYRQPVSRGGINAIRGVNSEAVISSLLEKGLIKELGRDKTAGNAILYGTTPVFLEKFGLDSVKDLPPLAQFEPQKSVKDAIKERLSATLPVDESAEQTDDDPVDLEIIE